MDNVPTYKTQAIRNWFAKRPRWHTHYTPTSASWISLVERFFANLTEKANSPRRASLHRTTRGRDRKLYSDSLGTRKAVAKRVDLDSFEGMIRLGFLSRDERSALIALARDGSVTHRLARRANALVLLDDGLSCEQVAQVLLLDDDTIRRWHGAFAEGGRKALMRFEAGGSACILSDAQQEKLVAWVRAVSPCSTREIGAWIAAEFGVEYDSRSGLVALLHRLGLEYRKPEVIPRHLDEHKQRAFIKFYGKLMNSLSPDEAVVFVDAVDPTHAARAARCWAAKDEKLAIEQTTGRQRLNIHGALDLETGQTKMIEAEAIDAASTIKLLASLEALYSTTALIHVFSTMRAIITPRLSKSGSRNPDAGSRCISSRRTARISIPSSGCGR